MKVLYISRFIENPPSGGNQLRAESSIKALSQICELHVCNATSNQLIENRLTEQALSFYSELGAHVLTLPSVTTGAYIPRFSEIQNTLVHLLLYSEETHSRMTHQKDAKYLIEYIRAYAITIVWFDAATSGLYPLMKALRQHEPSLRIVCDTDSVWSRYILRGTSYAKTASQRLAIQNEGLYKKQEEREWMRYAAVVTAVSLVDAEYYQRLAIFPEQVHLFPNVIDLSMYQNISPSNNTIHKPCIYLAGTFWSQSPMEDAARWIITEVLPLVRKRIPNIHFYIIGNNSDQTLSDIVTSDVTITGKVPSVLPYLRHADVALVPLRFESGTRFKILEAAACGVPIVSTTLGAEGLPVSHEQNILLADTSESFANSIVRLLEDPGLAAQLAENLQRLVTTHYSLETLIRHGQKILTHLEHQPTHPPVSLSPGSVESFPRTFLDKRKTSVFRNILKAPLLQHLFFFFVKVSNIFLYHLGFKIVTRVLKQGEYLPAKETREAAARNHQRVSEYVEELWGEYGLAQEAIEQFQQYGALHSGIRRVCEIGTGTGWFAEQVLRSVNLDPSFYESYEINQDWATWLTHEFNIVSQPADGQSLQRTTTGSIDFVHANGVFTYTSFFTTCRYFLEIFRVTAEGGYAAFDIFSEDCFDDDVLNAWLASDNDYPRLYPKSFVTDFFLAHGFSFIGEFYRKTGSGISVYLIFRKNTLA